MSDIRRWLKEFRLARYAGQFEVNDVVLAQVS